MRTCPHCRTSYPDDVSVCPNDATRLDEHAPTADLLIGQVLAERYRVIRRLGEGGMGRVYLAEHVRMGRMSAIKVMSPALVPTADAIGRFNREAANASRINHPNVAAIYDFGETADGTLYLAMEYVDGETLSDLIKHDAPLSLSRVSDLTRQMADALHAAHQLGIVHRDLKPDNILITHDADGVDRVKVVDFGIAKAMSTPGQTLTSAGVSIGTPQYMSPEQIAGSDVDFRSDIYSLGLVVFAMLTNSLPHPDMSSRDSLVQRLTERPKPLAEVRPDIEWPAKLQAALDRALSPDVADRYKRINDFALDVATAVGASGGAAQQRTRPMTPLGVAGITQPLRAANMAQPLPVALPEKSNRTLLVAGGIAAGLLLALGVWKFGASAAAPAAQVHPVKSDSAPVAVRPDTARKADSLPPTASIPSSMPAAHMEKVDSAVKKAAPKPVHASDTAKKAAVVASTPAQPAPAKSPITLPAGIDTAGIGGLANLNNRVGRRAGEHAWLRANGDSAAPATGGTPIQREAAEIMGHMFQTKKFMQQNKFPAAMSTLKTGFDEFAIFRAEHPGDRETIALGKELTRITDAARAKCEAARDSTVTAGGTFMIPCQMIQAGAAFGPRQGRGRRMNQP